jgi:hypothetical protein
MLLGPSASGRLNKVLQFKISLYQRGVIRTGDWLGFEEILPHYRESKSFFLFSEVCNFPFSLALTDTGMSVKPFG